MEAEKTMEEVKQQRNKVIEEIKKLGELKKRLNVLIADNLFYRDMTCSDKYPQGNKACREEREKIEQQIIAVKEMETKLTGILETLEQSLRKGNVPEKGY